MGGVEVLWLQLGITHPEAEKKAAEEGAADDHGKAKADEPAADAEPPRKRRRQAE